MRLLSKVAMWVKVRLSPQFQIQKPLLNTFRGGFSCFWGPKRCTIIIQKCDKTLFW